MERVITKDIILEELFFHQHRVGIMAYKLSRLSGNQKGDIDYFQAGWMHDEGKKRIDYRLLAKSEPLQKVEKQLLNQHPLFSFQILRDRGIPKEICEMALHHHENYDGTGYPSRLTGEKIPLGSRIIRICDVYDALTSKREYRMGKYYTQEDALAIMEEMKNMFDPELYQCFKVSINILVPNMRQDEVFTGESKGFSALSI